MPAHPNDQLCVSGMYLLTGLKADSQGGRLALTYIHQIFLILHMRLRSIIGHPGNSSIISRVKLRQTTVQLGKRAGFDDVGHCLGLTTGAQISVCKAPCHSTGPTVPMTGKETVQERPLLSWKGKTRLSYCGVVHQVGIDHRSRLPGFPPLTFDVGWSHDTP